MCKPVDNCTRASFNGFFNKPDMWAGRCMKDIHSRSRWSLMLVVTVHPFQDEDNVQSLYVTCSATSAASPQLRPPGASFGRRANMRGVDRNSDDGIIAGQIQLGVQLQRSSSKLAKLLSQPSNSIQFNHIQLPKLPALHSTLSTRNSISDMSNTIPTSTSVTESAVIAAPLAQVWHLIKLPSFANFWSKLDKAEDVKGTSDETDVVRWSFKDGTVLEVKQEEHSVRRTSKRFSTLRSTCRSLRQRG
jgi:hypothetical protein